MVRNPSILAYDDVKEHFERALMLERGLRVIVPSKSDAMALRARANLFRQLDRKQNTLIWAGTTNPLANGSAYDSLAVRVRPIEDGSGRYEVRFEKHYTDFQTEEI